MAIELLVPRRRLVVPKKPSYVALDMAMDGASATTLFDKSRYRNHGAITGASWATGLHGKALDFDPTIPSYVEIPATQTQLDFTSEDYSLVARIRADTLTVARMLICKGNGAVNGYQVYIDTAGRINACTEQAGAEQVSDSAAGQIVAGTRYTVGFSRSGASIRLYKNGVDVTSHARTHIDNVSAPTTTLIGIYYGGVSNPWDGQIEFLRIWKGIALSASEHLAFHNALA